MQNPSQGCRIEGCVPTFPWPRGTRERIGEGGNYETKASYAVTVSDGNGGADSINVTITVTDVDEPHNAPVFTDGCARELRRDCG